MKEDGGFTILELACSLVILGFIAVGLSYSIRFGLMSWELQGRVSSDVASAECAHRVLRSLIQQALPARSLGDKPFIGQEHRLVLITEIPQRSDVRVVWRARVAIGVDAHHRLLLRWQPFAMSVNETGPIAPSEEVLADGVEYINIYYRRPRSEGGAWIKTWNEGVLPAAVRVDFSMENRRRQWPYLEAATFLARQR